MLKCIPSEDHLARMYHELSLIGAACEGERRPWAYRLHGKEELFCLAADMSRHDPRLFSILVRFLLEKWSTLQAQKIRLLYSAMSAPQTIAVMAEFLLRSGVIEDEVRYFLEYLQRGLRPVPVQFYFHHLYVPGGNLMQRAVDESLNEYKRWGFIAREAPVIDDASRRTIGTHDAVTRKNILGKLIKDRKRITLSDYLGAVGNKISRQQALLDIKSTPGIKLVGNGRGAYWKFAT